MLINLVLTGLNAFNFEMEPDNENWFMAISLVNNRPAITVLTGVKS